MEELYYPCSENKGADQIHSFCEAETVQMICAFVFAYAKYWFSHGAAPIVCKCTDHLLIIISFLVSCLDLDLLYSIFK